jgi:hypothetical protein
MIRKLALTLAMGAAVLALAAEPTEESLTRSGYIIASS